MLASIIVCIEMTVGKVLVGFVGSFFAAQEPQGKMVEDALGIKLDT